MELLLAISVYAFCVGAAACLTIAVIKVFLSIRH
jgi:hypothetical protein